MSVSETEKTASSNWNIFTLKANKPIEFEDVLFNILEVQY